MSDAPFDLDLPGRQDRASSDIVGEEDRGVERKV